MIGSFSLNGVNSESFGLVCKSVTRPLLPTAKIKRVELAGASGVYDFDDNEYSLRPISMRMTYIGTSYQELRSRARGIASWLAVGTWSPLIINDEPDKYYLAKITEQVDLESVWESGTAEINFDCQPFAYSVTEKSYSVSSANAASYLFNNPGTRQIDYRSPRGSKFLIKIAGSWSSLSISLNGKTLNYGSAGSGTLIVDNVEMEVTLGGANKFEFITGDIDTFLPVIPGDNTISVSGSGLSATVTIEFIPMWM